MKYYHVSRMELVTEIIEPRYGFKLCEFDNQKREYAQIFKEIVFEQIRQSHFLSMPSRFRSVFLMENMDQAIAYKSSQSYQRNGVIYEVELIGNGTLNYADMTWLNCNGFEIQKMVEYAKNYWSQVMSDDPNQKEWLYEGRVRIVRKIEHNTIGTP